MSNNSGLSRGVNIFDILNKNTASSFDIKMYNYFEKFNMFLMQLLLEKGIMDKREIVELFVKAMQGAGESDDNIRKQVVQLRRIYQL